LKKDKPDEIKLDIIKEYSTKVADELLKKLDSQFLDENRRHNEKKKKLTTKIEF
jgi:hypothetical protein